MKKKAVKKTGPVALAEPVDPLAVPALPEEKRQLALQMFVLGVSRPRIARKLRIERAALTQAIREAEATGKLPSLEKRMTAMLGTLCEDVIAEKMRDPSRVSGYEFGVYFDKYRLLEGQATTIVADTRDTREMIAENVRKLYELAAGRLPSTVVEEKGEG